MSGLLPLPGLHLAPALGLGFGGYAGTIPLTIEALSSRASLVLLFAVFTGDPLAGKGKLALCF